MGGGGRGGTGAAARALTEESVGAGGDTHQLLLLHLAPFGLFLEELLPTLSLQRQLATCPLAIVHRARAIRPPRVSRNFRVEGTFSLLCRESSFPSGVARRPLRPRAPRRDARRRPGGKAALGAFDAQPPSFSRRDARRAFGFPYRAESAVSRVDFPRGERRGSGNVVIFFSSTGNSVLVEYEIGITIV